MISQVLDNVFYDSFIKLETNPIVKASGYVYKGRKNHSQDCMQKKLSYELSTFN